MKKPIEPTAHMVRLAKRWRRENDRLRRLSAQGLEPGDEQWESTWAACVEASVEFAAVAEAGMLLCGWLPLAGTKKKARKKR